jgi:hypothetical protein
MSVSGRFDPSRRAHRNTPQFRGQVTDLFEVVTTDSGCRPQAFLVEQEPGWSLPTHFHQEHQFQVVVGGDGTLGRSKVGPLSVHYASPHAAYGPLIAGPRGVAYLTLRAQADQGAWYLPDKREQLLVRIPKRHAHGEPRQEAFELVPLPDEVPVVETVLREDETGLAAWLVRVPPWCPVSEVPSCQSHGGRFAIVADGAVSTCEGLLSGLSVAWIEPDANLSRWRSQGEGAIVIIVQFPVQARGSFIESMKLPPLP